MTVEEKRGELAKYRIKQAEESFEEAVVMGEQKGIPFRKAADISGLDYWDFQAELDKRGVPVTTSLSFARKRLKPSSNCVRKSEVCP